MLFDWSAECGADDPVLVVPWFDPANRARFIDLREDPDAIDDIAEAEAHPPLLQALRALNALRSPIFTAKCDAWAIADAIELDALRMELDLAAIDGADGFASYIDVLWRDRNLFASFHQHEHLLHRIGRRVAPIHEPFAMLECIIRPALLDLAGPQEGFALSVYVKALGPDLPFAVSNWSAALQSAVGIFRAKDLIPNT